MPMHPGKNAFHWTLALWACGASALAQAPDSAPVGISPPAAVEAARAETTPPPDTSVEVAPTPVITAPAEAQGERSWRLGLALGYGKRTNPLIQSDDIPVILDVDVAWFGKRWFFDNGDLGFALLDRPAFTTSLVARVNSDRVFFGKTNTRFVNFSYQGANLASTPLVDSTTGAPAEMLVRVDPPDRSYAIEAGLETLFDGAWGSASLRAFHDVGKAHRGYEVAADYRYRVTRGRLSFTPSVGVAYKSARLNDYYWGVHDDEASIGLRAYRAGGGLGWEAGLRANYYVSKRLRFALSANYERLQNDVAESPLAAEDHVFGYFSGLAWTY
jgi:MipA family protein